MAKAFAMLPFLAAGVFFALGVIYMFGERIYWELTLPLWGAAAGPLILGGILVALERSTRE